MENPTHSFREINLVLRFISDLQIKSKTVMSRKRNRVKAHESKNSAICVTFN